MSDTTIQEIKNRLDIVDVISGYIQVKKSGSNFKAVCPFHSEKSASLMISQVKQIWHCFGCSEGGDIFGFVMRFEHLDFRETLELLAKRAGVELPTFKKDFKEKENKKEFLVRINSFAAKYYHQTLFSSLGIKALDYLHNRGLTDSILKDWQIGFAPSDFHSLEKVLISKKVSLVDMVLAGVSVKGEKGGQYDRFRNRITFPVFNFKGEIVGFSARLLPGSEEQAKYVNSPETEIYNKSQILFGLNFAKNEIRKRDEVVVVEGQMDCISAHKAGFGNTVATSGTALTSQQLQLLGRLTKNLKFCFDADSAGTKALERAGALALNMNFSVKVISLPSGKDPDELINSNVQAWKEAVEEAMWFIDSHILYALSKLPVNSVEQKKYVTQNIVPLLSFITDPLEQDHYISRLVQEFGVKDVAIRQAIKERKPLAYEAGLKLDQEDVGTSAYSIPDLEKKVLGGVLISEAFRQFAMENLQEVDFTSSQVYNLLKKLASSDKNLSDEETVLAKESEFVVESELEYLEGNQTALLNELQKSFYQLKLIAIKRHQQELTGLIRQAEHKAEKSLLQQLQTKFAKLSQERLEYERKV